MSENRPKLELELNTPIHLQLLYDKPIIGESTYGKYFLYSVLNGDGRTEYSYFATPEVHKELKDLKKGTEVQITKLAAQRGNKLVTTIDVKVLKESTPLQQHAPTIESSPTKGNSYLEAMQQSFRDANTLQQEFSGLNQNQIAVTLFIQRSKNFNYATA